MLIRASVDTDIGVTSVVKGFYTFWFLVSMSKISIVSISALWSDLDEAAMAEHEDTVTEGSCAGTAEGGEHITVEPPHGPTT